MPTVTINQFDGGYTNDARETSTAKIADSSNFDLVTSKNKISPIVDLEAEALSSGDITDKRFTDIYIDDNGAIGAIGRQSTADSTVINLFAKDSTTDISSTYTFSTGSALSAGELAFPGSAIIYNNDLYIITNGSGSGATVRTYDGSWTSLGSMSTGTIWLDSGVPRPYRHYADDLVYFAARHKLFRFTSTAGSAITSYFTFPDKFLQTSLTYYGSDLAVALTPRFGGNSWVAILDRISTNTSPRTLVDWGPGSLCVLENIGGVLIGISTNEIRFNTNSTYTVAKQKKLYVKAWAGGEVQTIAEIDVDSTVQLTNRKQIIEDRLYFGCNNDDALYCVTKNKAGNFVVYKSHYVANGTTATSLVGFNFIGDYLFTMVNTSGSSGLVYRTDNSDTYTNTSFIETLINPSMPISDRTKKKQLKAISVATAPMPSSGTVTVKYSVDGSAYTTLFTDSTDSKIKSFSTSESTGTPVNAGYEYQFKIETTGGAEVTELKYTYEVLSEVI